MVRVNFYLILGWLLLGGLVMPLHSSVLAHRQQQNVGYENTPTLILNKHAQAADTATIRRTGRQSAPPMLSNRHKFDLLVGCCYNPHNSQ